MSADAAALLELLAAGATTDEIAAAGADPHHRELALAVRRATDALVRREHELHALVETAQDLAALRDPAGVLDAIVRRARTLMGTDVAYLTLFDAERGDTYMRATAGSVSAAFQAVRLDLGAGLGGLVAKTHTPYWTPDYAADDRFVHTSAIDSAVGDEGIVAICGTPLLLQGQFVGVLFASHRTPRPYSRDEVALLGSLAALAAVSIAQVEAHEETARALAELSRAHETVRRQSDGVRRAAAAHDTFAQVVLGGGGTDEIAAAVVDLLGGWAVLTDAAGTVTSAAGAPPPGHRPGERLTPRPGAAAADRLTRDGQRWVVAVAAGDEVLGHLVVGGNDELDLADTRTVERAAVVAALVLLGERRRQDEQQRRRTDLVTAIVAGRGGDDAVATAAREAGIDPRRPGCVLVVEDVPPDRRRSVLLSVGSLVGRDGIVGEHDGRIVALLSAQDASAAAADLARRLARVVPEPLTVGGAGPGREPAEAFAEAVRAVAALQALGRSGEGGSADDLGFAGLVVGSGPQVAPFVRSVLGPVLDYDEARGTELVTTLDAYFAAGSSPRHAAAALHVHPNTVAQRLDRVAAVLGPGWQQPERALQVQLALHLRRLVVR